MPHALTLGDMSPRLRKVVGRESPRVTSTEEPDGGNLLVRIWRGAGVGNLPAYSTTAFSTDPIAPGVPPCSPCQSRRRATEQRETSQTAGQRRPDGGLGTEGRRVWRGGAGGDKLIGRSIDLEELHSTSRALEARVDEALAGNYELQSYIQRLDSGLVD